MILSEVCEYSVILAHMMNLNMKKYNERDVFGKFLILKGFF